jgi:hypothetical protein
MKKIILMFVIVAFASSTAFSAAFAPKLLKLGVAPEIQYDFDGTPLDIPVTVSGTDCELYFMVFTKGMASSIPNMRNGYLGYKAFCKIDTCMYLSPQYIFPPGANTVTWSGLDDDGGVIPPGEYSYYFWAFDSINPKTKSAPFMKHDNGSRTAEFIETEPGYGAPLNNPIWLMQESPCARWTFGWDPLDVTLLVVSELSYPEGYERSWGGEPQEDPYDYDYFYVRAGNNQTEAQTVLKYKFVPGGEAILQTDFGEDGHAPLPSDPVKWEPGVAADLNYIYTAEQNLTTDSEPNADFFIINFDGSLEEIVDLRPWWSSPAEYALGKNMNWGPDNLSDRMTETGFHVTLNCHGSCLKQVVDPGRYLDSGDYEDFFYYGNLNGDYILDQNFDETNSIPWACGTPMTTYMYSLDIDHHNFAIGSGYDHGAVSFGLIGPDGDGIGWCSFHGETAGWKKGTKYIDSDTPFDGIYCDNESAGGTHYQEGGWQPNEFTEGYFWVGHDSIKGVISNVVGVADDAPEAVDAITLAQNAPNPFNPTTTINYSIAKAGDTTIEVYNVAGQKVDTIVNEYMDSGRHSAVWDASEFSAGIYFCTVKSNGHSKTIKMTLVK